MILPTNDEYRNMTFFPTVLMVNNTDIVESFVFTAVERNSADTLRCIVYSDTKNVHGLFIEIQTVGEDNQLYTFTPSLHVDTGLYVYTCKVDNREFCVSIKWHW